MRKLLLMLIIFTGLASIAKSQNFVVKTGTNCTIMVERICKPLPFMRLCLTQLGTFPSCSGKFNSYTSVQSSQFNGIAFVFRTSKR